MFGLTKTVTIEVYINDNIKKTSEFDANADTCKLLELSGDEINLETLREEIFVAFRKTGHKNNFRNKELEWYIINYKDLQVIETDEDIKTEIEIISYSEEDGSGFTNQSLQLRVFFKILTAVAVVQPNRYSSDMKVEDTKEDSMEQESRIYNQPTDRLYEWLSVYKLESIYTDLKSDGYDSHQMLGECTKDEMNEICAGLKNAALPIKLKLKKTIVKYQASKKLIRMQMFSQPLSYESECQGKKSIEECEKNHRIGQMLKQYQELINAEALPEDAYRVDNINPHQLNIVSTHLDKKEICRISIIDQIHVQLFHGFDSGYRYKNKEFDYIAKVGAEDDEIEED